MLDRRSFLTAAGSLTAVSALPARAATGLPFKIYDTHAHFVSADVKRYPLTGLIPNAPGGPPALTPSAPNFPTIENDLPEVRLIERPTTAQRIFSWWDANGVDAGVGVQYRTAYGINNDYLLATADANARRVTPIVILDAVAEDTPARLREMAKEHGAAGIRITGPAANMNWLDSAEAKRTWAVANDLGLTVVVMYMPRFVSAPALNRLGALAAAYPKTNVVLDHIGWLTSEGGPNFGILPEHKALAAHGNAYFKFTTLNLNALDGNKVSPAAFVRHAVDALGSDRLVWGSDIGNSPGAYDTMVKRAVAATAQLTDAERRRMLSDNGRKVFIRGGRAKA